MITDQFNFIADDKGKMIMQGKGLRNFLAKHAPTRGIITVRLFDERNPKQIAGYFKAFIVPEFQKAFYQLNGERIDIIRAEEELYSMSEITRECKSIYDLEVHEIWLFIEEIKIKIAENYNYFIYIY